MKDLSSKEKFIDCDFDPEAMTIDQASKVILQTAQTVSETELVDIRSSLGRVLGKDIIATIDNPPNDNSAMDGYGVRTADCKNTGATLKVIGKSFAGKPFAGYISKGEAVRIMTGAKIPQGVDAIVMQEQTSFAKNNVTINAKVKVGQNIRLQGEDISKGQLILKTGSYLTPAKVGMLASIGIVEIRVIRKINVAILSTGDELQNVGTPLKKGGIYDSNRYLLYGLLNKPCINIIEKGIINDKQESIKQSFIEIAKYVDVVITTGGVSVGEADWIKDCVMQTGDLIFWKAAIKPGRPIAFGRINKSLFFGLPGNPVSVMITFTKFASLALQKLTGQAIEQPLRLSARLLSPVKKRLGRVEFQRGIMSYDENDELCVETTGDQGSGILRSMAIANCLIVMQADEINKNIGDKVTVEPFSAGIIKK